MKRVCKECGKIYQGSRHTSFCQECIDWHSFLARQNYQRQKKAGTLVHVGSIVNCIDCGKEIIKKGRRTIRCESCQKAYNYKRMLELKNERFPPINGLYRVCRDCGRPLDNPRKQPTRCKVCAKKKQREQQRSFQQKYREQKRKEGNDATSPSGISGVIWDKVCKKWRVEISSGKKRWHVGSWEDLDEAKRNRLEAKAFLLECKETLTGDELDSTISTWLRSRGGPEKGT